MYRIVSYALSLVMACRKCYQDLADQIKTDPTSTGDYSLVAITGTPGVGKSTFLVVLAQVCSSAGRKVSWLYHAITSVAA